MHTLAVSRTRSASFRVALAWLAIPAAAGATLGLAFPPSPVGRAGWVVAMLGIAAVSFAASRAADLRSAFLAGALFGLVAYGVAFRGFLLRMGPVSLLVLAVTAFLIGVWAAVVYLAPSRIRFFLAPLAWVAMEAMRGWILAGAYWDPIALTQIDLLWARQIAGWAGRDGITLVAVGLAVGLAAIASQEYFQAGALLAGALAIALIPAVTVPPLEGKPVKIAAVQTGYDNFTKWMPANLPRILRELEHLSSMAAGRGARIVAWPETAVPADPFANPVARETIIRSAKKASVLAGVLVGPPQLGPAGRLFSGPVSAPRPINLLLLVDRSGNPVGKYAKSVAFPYGELGLVRGPGFVPMRSPAGRLGAVICWENSMPSASLQYARSGAGVVVAAANLAWFGSVIDSQYLAHSRLLAAEMRVPVIQSVNGGRSAIIDGDGNVVAIGPERGPGVVSAVVMVPKAPGRGPVIAWILRIAAFLITVAGAAAYIVLRDTPATYTAQPPRRILPLFASISTLVVLTLLYGAGYVIAGFPLGRPSLLLFAMLLLGGVMVGYLLFGPTWHAAHVRFGPGVATTFVIVALMTVTRVVLPPEAAGWMYFHILPLTLVRRKFGDELAPALTLALATAMSPVWVAMP